MNYNFSSDMRIFFILLILLSGISDTAAQDIYKTNFAKIQFASIAPLEIIKASSQNCQGILSLPSGEFVFRVFIKTFDGFNSPLQKEHFYENYLETNEFPEALFKGFILEELNLNTENQQIRAKGELTIHGVSKEEIITVNITKLADANLAFESEFKVILDHYKIDIPNIVKQKIAEKITVTVSGTLEKRSQ